MRAEQLTEPVCYHAEGPVWSSRWGGLRWVDMLAGDVMGLGADGSISRTHVDAVVAALRPRRSGGAALGVERGFALQAVDGTVTKLEVLGPNGIRMNEGGCDPDGRFYCGSMAYDKTPGVASLYRLDPDGSTNRLFGDVTISNGLGWSPAGDLAYYVDTDTRRVDVFDYDRDLGLTGRRSWVTFGPDDGWPDGLTVDSEGGVWVAANGGGGGASFRRERHPRRGGRRAGASGHGVHPRRRAPR